MARMAKMESCPKCGAALAANLVKLLKTDPENYVCPSAGAEKRKDWESNWGDDIDDEMNDRLTAQFEKAWANDWNKEQMSKIAEDSVSLG